MSFLSLTPDNQNKICDLFRYLSKTEFENTLPSLPHLHQFTEVILITNGQGFFVANETLYPVKKGDLLIVESGMMHTEMSSNEQNLHYYSLGLKNISLSKLKEHFVFPSQTYYTQLQGYFTSMFSELKRKEQGYDIIIKNLIENIYLLIERISLLRRVEDDDVNYGNLKPVIEYIDTNYSQNITLDMLCKIAFLSKPHLIRSFKNITAQTPIEYLKNRRISASKTLLITTGLSISDIAMMLNFPSSSNFIQAFKKLVGTTPLSYRNSNIDKDNFNSYNINVELPS